MCMCVGRGADCLRCWAAPGGAEWSYCQAPVHLLPWQQQWPRCCHGKFDTKRRGVGTGPGVMSEGQGVKGHNQLDSTQEEARVRKEGGKVCLSCFCCFLSSRSSLGRETSDEWTPLDINIELDDGMNWDGKGVGSPQHPDFWRVPYISTFSCWRLIAQNVWQAIGSSECKRDCGEKADGCVWACVAAAAVCPISDGGREQEGIHHFIRLMFSLNLFIDNKKAISKKQDVYVIMFLFVISWRMSYSRMFALN